MAFDSAAMADSVPPFSDAAYYNPTNCPIVAKLCRTLNDASVFGHNITVEKVLLLLLSDVHGSISAASPEAPALGDSPGAVQNTADEWAKEQVSLHFPSVLSNKACGECRRRKKKCVFSTANGPKCDDCFRRGRDCLPQPVANGRLKRKRNESIACDEPASVKRQAVDYALQSGDWAEAPQVIAPVQNAASELASRPVVGGGHFGFDPSPATGADQYAGSMVPLYPSCQNLPPLGNSDQGATSDPPEISPADLDNIDESWYDKFIVDDLYTPGFDDLIS